jgi:hypothetical protein
LIGNILLSDEIGLDKGMKFSINELAWIANEWANKNRSQRSIARKLGYKNSTYVCLSIAMLLQKFKHPTHWCYADDRKAAVRELLAEHDFKMVKPLPLKNCLTLTATPTQYEAAYEEHAFFLAMEGIDRDVIGERLGKLPSTAYRMARTFAYRFYRAISDSNWSVAREIG